MRTAAKLPFRVWLLAAFSALLPLRESSYVLIFLFLCLNLVDTRYLYSPYDEWLERALGFRMTDLFEFQRNPYDRRETVPLVSLE